MKILSSELSNLTPEVALKTILLQDVEWEYSEAMENWEKYGFVCKDVSGGEIFKVKELNSIEDNTFSLLCDGGVNLLCNLKKEKKFFEILGKEFEDIKDFSNWLRTPEAQEWFIINETFAQCIGMIDGMPFGSLLEAHFDYQKQEFMNEIKNPTKVYKAYIKDKNLGGFIAIVNGVNAFLPGSLAAANKIVNFDTFIGKTVYVMFEDYIKDGDTFIVSNKKYIQKILPEKIRSLKFDRPYMGEVTGTSKFGIFIEFDGIFTGLLHITEMTELTKNRFKEGQFLPGDDIEFFIKEILKDSRIILSEMPLSTDIISIEEFKENYQGTVLEGEITGSKHYGYFVKFIVKDSIFTGLLYIKNIEDHIYKIGQKIDCFIDNVDTESKKIYLKQINNND